MSEKAIPSEDDEEVEKEKEETRPLGKSKSTSEEPGSSKKAKVELSELERKANLKTQKVLLGRVFDPLIAENTWMKELVDIVEFQKWSHLFTPPCPNVYEDEMRGFYIGQFVVDEDTLCLNDNWKEFILEEDALGKILGVPLIGLHS